MKSKKSNFEVISDVNDVLCPIYGLYNHISRVDDDNKVDYSSHVLVCVSHSSIKLEEFASILNRAEDIKRKIQPRNLMRERYYVEPVVNV